MRTLAVHTFLTLDGVMQSPGSPDEDTSGGFSHGGWSVPYWDDVMGEVMNGFMREGGFEMLLGRITYEHMAAHWPNAPAEEQPEVMNKNRKHVASRTLKAPQWENSTVIKGDVVDYVKTLRKSDGAEIQVHGSGNLVQTLLKHDLVDEFRLWIYPVLLGEGKRLFAGGTVPAGLKLVETRTAESGPIFARYERSGKIGTGSYMGDAAS